MSTRDQRQTAFRNAGAILVLQRMVEPEGYAHNPPNLGWIG